MATATATKKRKENWTRAEQESLINKFTEHGDTLSMKLCPGLTSARKDGLWMEILDK